MREPQPPGANPPHRIHHDRRDPLHLRIIGEPLQQAVFAFYVVSFASYNKTYGAIGGIVVFRVWLWTTNLVILLGAELNAELERGRLIEAGHPADREPYLPARDESHA